MDEWTRWLSEPVRGRKVMLPFQLLAGATSLVARLLEWGARRPLVLSAGDGTGPLPDDEDVTVVRLSLTATRDMTDQVRQWLGLYDHPPAQVAAAVEAYDPEHEALWWAMPFTICEPFLGRAVLGGRRREWAALEDKMLCDELWETAGVRHARSVVAPVGAASHAARTVDVGDGTVWAGDARDGLNGGSDFVRRVRTAGQAALATAFFEPRCDRVRVMPYLEGTACSIHGFVLPDGTATFRPVEMLQIEDRTTGRFAFAGMSTWWDPSAEDREVMRDAARSVGELLRARVDYRGGFGIDGVLTADGFRPTELNPRFSGGLSTISRSVPDLPLGLLQANAVIGRDVRITAAGLESALTRAADASRLGNVLAVAPGRSPEKSGQMHVRLCDGQLVRCDVDERTATVSYGPNPSGTFFRAFLDDRTVRPGESAAPFARALRRFALTHGR
ncbi:MAG: hypothetical protein ACRDO8_08950 [Nocardioidaceae bacterium]